MTVEEQRVARHPVWSSLLHLQDGVPQIKDRKFLLSWPDFTPEAELGATLELLKDGGLAAVCRFPARALWLQGQLALPVADTEQCPEIAEFVAKAPFDTLELVFADESVTQPASILGHSFLRIAGERQGQTVEHAVSFYTHAETLNLPKLLWESLVTGKDGMFSLTPYADEERRYLEEEQRNLWRYAVRTTPSQRALIRNHLFELKNSKLTYFFHRYNCATVLRNIVGLSGDLSPTAGWWTTPKDLAKDFHAAGRIENTQVHLADAWLVAKLASELPDKADIRAAMLAPPAASNWPRKDWGAGQVTALQAYNRWLRQKGKIGPGAYTSNATALGSGEASGSGTSFRIDAAQDPILSEGDSHWRTEWRRTGAEQKLLLQWTPAAHALMQPHDRASAETEMLLLSPTLSVDRDQRVRIEEFQLFSMKSLVPWEPLLRSWSTQTLIGYGSLTGHPLDSRSMQATLQLGWTLRQGALDLFALSGPALRSHSLNSLSAYLRTDVGGLWRHGGVAKSRLTWSSWAGANEGAHKLEFDQAWFLRPNWLAGWRYSDTRQFMSHARSLGVYLLHSF